MRRSRLAANPACAPTSASASSRPAAELDYHPDLIARTLASAGAHSIGVVIGRFVDPRQAAVAREIDRVATGAGYDVLPSVNAETGEDAEQSVRMLMARRVAGALLVGAP